MNFHDARNAQHAQDLAPSPSFVSDEERCAHRHGQVRFLFADRDERVVAEWRRAHPKEAAAEAEFWATRVAERLERKAERKELSREKRARKGAAEFAADTVNVSGYCSWDEEDSQVRCVGNMP